MAGQGAEFRISARRGDGVLELIAALVVFARDYFGSGEGGLIGRARQRKLLQETASSLQRSIEVIGKGEELAAEELRMAVHSLGRLLGRVDVEEILEVIFRNFCIGK
jgi:tRNA modification GTPase